MIAGLPQYLADDVHQEISASQEHPLRHGSHFLSYCIWQNAMSTIDYEVWWVETPIGALGGACSPS